MPNEPKRRPDPKKFSHVGEPNSNGPTRLRPRQRSSISWNEVDTQLLRDTVCAVCDAGAAILLSRTSDGGAFSITVMDGNERIREYPNSIEDAESVCRWLVNMFAAD